MSIWRAGSAARVYLGSVLASAVYKGTTEVWRRDPQTLTLTATGPVVVPSWAAYADRIALGGGGGGGGGEGTVSRTGNGGGPGQFAADTISVKPGDTLTVTVGPGGAPGAKEKSGSPGRATTITGAGGPTLTGAGGTAGSGYGGAVGGSPGTYTHPNGPQLVGGSTAGTNTDGQTPGGGGGPGSGGIFGSANPGRPGAGGAALIRFRSY